jgi:hypothetical protein
MLFEDEADGPPFPDDAYLAADNFAEEIGIQAEIAALQEAEHRYVRWLCANGREDEPVNGGMPAWWYKALELDEP